MTVGYMHSDLNRSKSCLGRFLLLFLLIMMQPYHLSAAIKMSGLITIKIYYVVNQPPTIEKSSFEATSNKTNFWIGYTDEKGNRIQIGTDRGDVFSVEYHPGVGGYESGFVGPGLFPAAFSQSIGQLLCLGLYSDVILGQSDKDFKAKIPLQKFALSRGLDPNSVRITNTFSIGKNGFLHAARFYFPGEYVKDHKTFKFDPPYNCGYLVGEFGAVEFSTYDNYTGPMQFNFMHYVPASSPKNKDDVRIFEDYSFEITNIEAVNRASFLPEIETERIQISDSRFNTNSIPYGYGTRSKKWITRGTSDFSILNGQASQEVPEAKFAHQLRLKRLTIWTLMLLSAFGGLFLLFKNLSKTTKQK